MSLLKDLFNKEKSVLSKAEKRIAQAEREREERGDARAAESFERALMYLDKNEEVFERLKADFSKTYTRLGTRLESVGRDASAAKAYDKALSLDEENFDALNSKGAFLLERDMEEGALALFDRALGLSPSNAITRFNRARALLALDRKDEAREALRSLVDDEPKNLEYLDTLLSLEGDDLELMSRKAYVHRDRGEVEEALESLERALALSPDERGLWVLKADLASDRGDDELQVEALERAVAAGGAGTDPLLLRRLGRIYMRVEDHEKALHAFNRGLDVEPGEPGLLRGRADALYGIGRLSEADWAYSEALKKLGDDADKDLLIAAARVKSERGDPTEAAKLLERAIEHDPDNPELRKARSEVLASQGEYLAALEELEAALRMEVNDLDGWIKIVEILKHLDDDAHLAKCARRVVELDPERRETWIVLGDALTRLERPEEAVEAYDAAIELRFDDPLTLAKRLEVIAGKADWEAVVEAASALLEIEPEHLRAIELKSDALERLGRHDETVKVAEQHIRMDGKNVEAFMRKARSLKAMDDLEGAAEVLRAALQVDKRHMEAQRLLAEVLVADNRSSEAMPILDELVGLHPEEVDFWVSKGRIHLEQDEPELAHRAFDRALELRGEDAEVLALQGRTLSSMGEHAAALKLLEKAMELSPEDPDVHMLAGKALDAQGKYALAEQAFDRALKLRPSDLELMNHRKRELISLEKHEEVVKLADEILELDPRDVQTLLDQGAAYTHLGRPPLALKSYQLASDLEPESVEILEMVAASLKNMDQRDELAETVDRILALDPQNREAWSDKGVLLKDQDRNEEALRCFEEVISIDPEDASAHNNHGVVLAALGRYEDAAQSYRRAIELDPKDVGAVRNLGIALTHQDLPEDALMALDTALALDPRDAATWNNKGLALSKLGKLKEALDCFDRGIGLDPKDPAIRNNKGTVLARMGRLEDSVKSYLKTVEIDPDDKSAWFNLGICYDRLKMFNEAVDALTKATDLAPDDKAAWHNMGLILIRATKFEEAVEAFNKAVALSPRDPSVWNNRGIALDQLERWEEAIQSYTKALEIEPLDKVAWYNKAVAYFQLKQYAEAVDSFNTALEIDPKYHQAAEKRQEALDFIKHKNVEKYARQILSYEYKHRRVPSKEEAIMECNVPIDFIDETYDYLRAKESIRLENLSPEEVADYEKATAQVVKFCLRHKPHTDDISVTLAELLFHFPDTSIPRAKRILDYLGKVDKLKILPPQPMPPELEKAVRMALELPADRRTIADISRRLTVGIYTSKKIKAVLDHIGMDADLTTYEVQLESLRRPRKRAPSKSQAALEEGTAGDEPGAPAAARPEPRIVAMKEPVVCSVCQKKPPSIRHFDCGQFICDDCIREANVTRLKSKHLPTICPKCKMPIIEGSTDEVL